MSDPAPAPAMQSTATSLIKTNHIVKLNSDNWNTWNFQLSVLLKHAKLWDIVTGVTRPPAATASQALKDRWVESDIAALAIIVPTLNEVNTTHVYSCETSAAVYAKLKSIHADNSSLNKQQTLTTFLTYQVKQGQSLVEAYSEVEDLVRHLKDMNVQIDDITAVTKIVSSLPPEHQAFKKAWDSVPSDQQTMANLFARLKKEELESKLAAASPAKQPPSNSRSFQTNHMHTRPPNTPPRSFQSYRPRNPHPSYQPQQRQDYIKELKRNSNCSKCGKQGHWAKECRGGAPPPHRYGGMPPPHRPNYNQQQFRNYSRYPPPPRRPSYATMQQQHQQFPATQQSYETDEHFSPRTAFMAGERHDPEPCFISDSGASQHFCGNLKYFSSYQAFDSARPINLTDNHSTYAEGSGTIKVNARFGSVWKECTIQNVWYIPNAVNLFSEGVMASQGYTIVRDAHSAIFYDQDNKIGPSATRRGNIYVMDFQIILPNVASYSSVAHQQQLWHERTGHICPQYIAASISKQAVKGLDKFPSKLPEKCELCALGKQVSQSHPSVPPRPLSPGEMASIDLAGPMRTTSISGCTYLLLCRDHYSGFRVGYFLKHKNEAASFIKDFLHLMHNQTGKWVRILRSDNGTEFINHEVAQLIHELGIVHETSPPHTPQCNGKIERDIRTICETARTLMIRYKTPEFLWEEAVRTAIYLRNRFLDRNLSNKTPFEIIFGRKPSLQYLKVFGCRAVVKAIDRHSKFAPKGTSVLFVGYDGSTHNYRFYDSVSHKIIRSHDATFFEDLNSYGKAEIPIQTEPAFGPKDSNPQPIPSLMEMPVTPPSSEPDQNPHNLRDRSRIKKPSRFKDSSHTASSYSTILEPQTLDEAVASQESEQWKSAMQEEIDSHQSNGTWKLVPRPPSTKVLKNRWIFKHKLNSDGSVARHKARLVAKGYLQTPGIDYTETFAGVCRYESIRIVLTIAISSQFYLEQLDIKTAFLYGSLEETIYMEQPPGYAEDGDLVCQLIKSLYGLKQSPRCWNTTFTNFLTEFNLKPTSNDPCVFVSITASGHIYLCLYVDDMLLASSSRTLLDNLIHHISSMFQVKTEPLTTFLGIQLQKVPNGGYFLHQSPYIESILEQFHMTECKPQSVPLQPATILQPATSLETENNIPYRQLLGALLFLTRITRPDIAFAVHKLSRYMANFNNTHWQAAKGVLRYLQGTTSIGIPVPEKNELILSGYSDSDFASDPDDRVSVSGYVFFLGSVPVTWASQKQPIVATSSTEAEYIALSDASRECLWLRAFLQELGHPQHQPTQIQVDNQSAIKLAQHPQQHRRSKHIDVRFHFTRELVANQVIDVNYVPTAEQTADIFTKPLHKAKHEDMVERLHLTRSTSTPTHQRSSAVSLSTLLWTSLLVCLIIPASTFTIKDQPILWRSTSIPVANGQTAVHLTLQLKSPCSLLSSDNVPLDQLPYATAKCNTFYQELLLIPLREICPTDYSTLSRSRRELITIITLAIAAISVALGTAATVVAVNDHDKIASEENAINLSFENQKALQDTINNITQSLTRLSHDYVAHRHDYLEFKNKSLDQTFMVSYIASSLRVANAAILTARREWAFHRVSPTFLDYFNITLPCGNKCPYEFSHARSCSFQPKYSTLSLRFTIPTVNSSLALVEADPFILRRQKGNLTCTVSYTGPKNAIIHREKSCIFATNLRRTGLIMSPYLECLPQSQLPASASYFRVQKCVPTTPEAVRDFIQVKLYQNEFYIYCPDQNFTIGSTTVTCPDHPFALPFNTTFAINNHLIGQGEYHIFQLETYDPALTAQVNFHLQPHIDADDIDEEISNLPELNLPTYTIYTRPWFPATSTLTVILVALAVYGVFQFFRRRSAPAPPSAPPAEQLQLVPRVSEGEIRTNHPRIVYIPYDLGSVHPAVPENPFPAIEPPPLRI